MQTRETRMTRLRTLVTSHSRVESHTMDPSPVNVRRGDVCIFLLLPRCSDAHADFNFWDLPLPSPQTSYVRQRNRAWIGIDSHKFAMTKYWQTMAPLFTTDVENVLMNSVTVLEKVEITYLCSEDFRNYQYFHIMIM